MKVEKRNIQTAMKKFPHLYQYYAAILSNFPYRISDLFRNFDFAFRIS